MDDIIHIPYDDIIHIELDEDTLRKLNETLCIEQKQEPIVELPIREYEQLYDDFPEDYKLPRINKIINMDIPALRGDFDSKTQVRNAVLYLNDRLLINENLMTIDELLTDDYFVNFTNGDIW